MAGDIMLAWLGTIGLLGLLLGFGRAKNAKTGTIALGVSFIFWITFLFMAFQQEATLLAFLGLSFTGVALAGLVYGGLRIYREEAGAGRPTP